MRTMPSGRRGRGRHPKPSTKEGVKQPTLKSIEEGDPGKLLGSNERFLRQN